jgi:hypothetical protein
LGSPGNTYEKKRASIYSSLLLAFESPRRRSGQRLIEVGDNIVNVLDPRGGSFRDSPAHRVAPRLTFGDASWQPDGMPRFWHQQN